MQLGGYRLHSADDIQHRIRTKILGSFSGRIAPSDSWLMFRQLLLCA